MFSVAMAAPLTQKCAVGFWPFFSSYSRFVTLAVCYVLGKRGCSDHQEQIVNLALKIWRAQDPTNGLPNLWSSLLRISLDQFNGFFIQALVTSL